MLNRNPLRTFVMLAALATAACDVQGALDDLEQKTIDASFKAVADNAKANGGEAILVRPGKEYTLTVNNPSSAINGATIKIAADALPADFEQAALAIQVAPVASVSTEGLKVAGPTAGVILTKIPGGEMLVPVKALSFGLPYAADTSYDTKKLKLAVIGADGKIVIPEGSSSDEAKKQVLGDSITFNVINAVYEVDYVGGDAPAGSFIYKITNADGSKSCSGLNEAPAFPEKKLYFSGTDYSFSIDLAGQGSLGLDAVDNNAAVAVPTTTWTVPQAPTSTGISCVTLDGTTLGGMVSTFTLLDFTLSEFTGDVAGAAETCGANACTPHTVSVKAVAHFDYVTATGDIVKAALDTTIPDFTWYVQ